MRNWQTTVAGLGAIAAGVYLLKLGGTDDVIQGAALITVGAGLIRAKDAADHSTPAEVAEAGAVEKEKTLKAISGR